ncbi:proliferating cell nuclear antigen (pcna) [Candidatus Pacearchaeota archaeon]|nr:proliferating cell nuclear antigen (pcna) [Candidatus Pacearchaeota archaeon]
MLLKLNEPKILADAIAIISELVTEVRAKITKQGFSIIAIDPANVALVSLKIPTSAFSQFDVEKDEELGLNLDDLKSVLRRCGIGSTLVLQREDNTLKMQIQDKVKRSFSLALIDIDSEEKQIPQLEFVNRIEIPSSHLSEAIEDASIVADACSLSTNKKDSLFIIDAKGSLNSAKSEFTSDEAKMQISDAKAKYSLEYLQKFIKAARISDKAVLQFSSDYPCKLDFKSQNLELSFILAPRVETED